MKTNIRNIIIAFLVGIGMLIYLWVFIQELIFEARPEGDPALQLAMTMSVSISTFIGAILGIDTRRRIQVKTQGLEFKSSNPNTWMQKLQVVLISIYAITLLIAVFQFLNHTDSRLINSLWTTATGLFIGALAVILTPVEGV